MNFNQLAYMSEFLLKIFYKRFVLIENNLLYLHHQKQGEVAQMVRAQDS